VPLERYLRVDAPPPPAWDAIAVSTRPVTAASHQFPHHRAAVCQVLNCKAERDDVQAALMKWKAEAFETAAYAAGGVVAMMRPYDEWSATPHARALAQLPLITIEKIGEAAPKPWPKGDRPLAGIRVLDLARHRRACRRLYARRARADVMLVSGPDSQSLALHRQRPRRPPSFVEPKSEQGRATMAERSRRPTFSQGYRSHALAALGLRLMMPRGSIRGSSMSAVGLWPCRPLGGAARRLAGADHNRLQSRRRPGRRRRRAEELPAQMLDHATGSFAFGAMMARRARRAKAAAGCPDIAGADRAITVELRRLGDTSKRISGDAVNRLS
jgi:hypothetical protein